MKDVLFKPVKDFIFLRQLIMNCIYEDLFVSPAVEKINFINEWKLLHKNAQKSSQLLIQLQPPPQQKIAGCILTYQQLTTAQQPELILDITELSKDDFAFYCLDITKAGENGILGALLSRVLFSRFVRKHLMKNFDTNKKINLPYITKLLKYLNKFLSTFHIKGQFPLLTGYYNTKNKNLILVSAGLPAYVITEKNKIQMTGTAPLGSSNIDYFDYISEHCHF